MNLPALFDQYEKDKAALVQVARKKRIMMPPEVKSNEDALIFRYISVVADGHLKNAITSHSEYIDYNGAASTSKKFFMLSINKKIKALLGDSVAELRKIEDIETLARLRDAATAVIYTGEMKKKSRKEIKEKLYEVLKNVANGYW
jgi:hypothetical protein